MSVVPRFLVYSRKEDRRPRPGPRKLPMCRSKHEISREENVSRAVRGDRQRRIQSRLVISQPPTLMFCYKMKARGDVREESTYTLKYQITLLKETNLARSNVPFLRLALTYLLFHLIN